MCGIFSYIGSRNAVPILIDGLKTLEYRGYDSAGIFIPSYRVIKSVGSPKNLEKILPKNFFGFLGIAHTRWATHGKPTKENAHPHGDCSGRVWLVHNGIIENYKELKEKLEKKGHKFSSETDSEILTHLIEEELKVSKKTDIEQAVLLSIKKITGTYGIVVIDNDNPNKIVTARMGSPIVLGIGKDEYFVASDPSVILRYTRDVVYLNDGEFAVLTPKNYKIFTLNSVQLEREPEHIEWDIQQLQKGGYEHFMLKEIMEAPEVLRNSARGRVILKDGVAKLGGIYEVKDKLRKIERIIIVGCGSAYYAGMTGKYMLEQYAGIPTEVEIASEFRYQQSVLDKNTAILAISQSGETADTIASIREAKRKGLLIFGIVNTVGSTIAREVDAGIYNHAGPEIGVASTKAFLSQLEVLVLLTLYLGRSRNMSITAGKIIANEIKKIPEKVEKIFEKKEHIQKIAKKYYKYNNFLYIGRQYSYPIACEGALKLKEISYIHAEGYSAGEMKHGPLAMIEKDFPTVAIVPHDSVYEKTISNIEEIKARDGKVLAIATEGDDEVGSLVDDVIYIPETIDVLSPILSVVPLHLFAYYIGKLRGHNLDKPRNLAKSVTVE